jgi:hypothetical protein
MLVSGLRYGELTLCLKSRTKKYEVLEGCIMVEPATHATNDFVSMFFLLPQFSPRKMAQTWQLEIEYMKE